MRYTEMADAAVRGLGAMQKPKELEALLRWIAPLGLSGVLEIGGMHGGTLWAWSQVCNGPYVCVDLQVLEGRMEACEGLDYRLVVADSTDRKTVHCLDGLRFDFIFIDGSHRYEDVSRDAENWMPLLSDRGVIAFHDICHRRMAHHDMWRFWHNLVESNIDWPSYEIYDPEQQWGGIGVLSARALDSDVPYCHLSGTLEKPIQCEEQVCQCCGINLNLEHGEEVLCVKCASIPSVAR